MDLSLGNNTGGNVCESTEDSDVVPFTDSCEWAVDSCSSREITLPGLPDIEEMVESCSSREVTLPGLSEIGEMLVLGQIISSVIICVSLGKMMGDDISNAVNVCYNALYFIAYHRLLF